MTASDPSTPRERDPVRRRFHSLRLALLFAATLGGVAPGELSVAAEESAQIAGTGGTGVRLRDHPGLDSGVLLVVPEGATVALVGTTQRADGHEWAPVRYSEANGWVAAIYLRSGATPATATPATPVAAAAVPSRLTIGEQATVTGTGGASLRIRAEASLDAPILAHAPFGSTVTITAGPRGDWYGVQHGAVAGWASGRFLAPVAMGATAQPATTPAPAPPVAATAVRATSTPATGATTATGSSLVAAALRYLGVPYVWGGATPAGWDCSGFVVYVYREVTGRTLPRTTQAQWGVGTPVAREALRAGDLVFFQNTYEPGITHVGFALGDGRFVHAAAPGVGTVISSLADPYWGAHYAGARRV